MAGYDMRPDKLRDGQLDEELASLKPYPGESGCFELAEYKADKQATVCVKNNHYSVPDSLAGEKVIVQMYSEKIVIYDNGHKKVAQHVRSYGTNEWIVDFCHYIPTLMKKTAAIEYSEAFHQMPQKMQDIFRSHFKVALQTLSSEDLTFREDQKTDEFLEIEIGSEDILQQLENVMELKLPTIKDGLDDMVSDAVAERWDYRRFLRTLLQREVEQRFENRKYQRIRNASFPQLKYLHELEREELPADGRSRLPEFENLGFIREGRNIVMYGNPGTGKTHIAIGLGIKACMEGYTVYFTTVPHLLTKTNLPFTRWEEIFKDKVLCSALVDRLYHKAYMVNMTGQSYRVRETQKMLKNLE